MACGEEGWGNSREPMGGGLAMNSQNEEWRAQSIKLLGEFGAGRPLVVVELLAGGDRGGKSAG